LNKKIKELEALLAHPRSQLRRENIQRAARTRELEKELESLKPKPSTEKVANCVCCQKIRKVEDIDKSTGCCVGGCK